jgi:hypothetical protein
MQQATQSRQTVATNLPTSLSAWCAPASHLAYASEQLKRREQRAENDNGRTQSRVSR